MCRKFISVTAAVLAAAVTCAASPLKVSPQLTQQQSILVVEDRESHMVNRSGIDKDAVSVGENEGLLSLDSVQRGVSSQAGNQRAQQPTGKLQSRLTGGID